MRFCDVQQILQLLGLEMINKKRKQQRAKTAPHHKTLTLERKSYGEDAKQILRNMSLINNNQHASDKNNNWTKQQDNLSTTSFLIQQQPKPTKSRAKLAQNRQKKYHQCARNSSPLLSSKFQQKRASKPYKTQLIPSSVDINNYFVKQRMHLSQRQNIVNNQIRLFNSIIFRKSAIIMSKSFRSLSNQKREQTSKEKTKNQNYFNLNIKNHCKQIIPLKINFSMGVDKAQNKYNTVLHSLADERLKQNKANIVRKLLKDQRKNNLNESMFNKGELRPEF